METPTITLYGKTYAPKPPKMKVWRRFLAFFDEDKKNLSVEEFLEVTREAIDDNVEVADIVPLTRELFRWIQSLTFQKLVKLPNDEAGKA